MLFPSPQDLPDPGIEPRSPTFRADTLQSEPPGVDIKLALRLFSGPATILGAVNLELIPPFKELIV